MNQYDNEEFFKEYSQMARSIYGLEGAGEWPQMNQLFTDLKEARILDLGCGYGWHARYAINQGAKEVVAVDGSIRMLEKAKEMTSKENITYIHSAIEEFQFEKNYYNIIISNLVFHYIEDLQSIYKKIYDSLQVGGYLLFNIEHPTFTAGVNQTFVYQDGKALYWPIVDYFIEGNRSTDFLGKEINKQHHTLTTIINGLIQCGFKLEAVEEVCPEMNIIEANGWWDELKRPMMLLVKARK